MNSRPVNSTALGTLCCALIAFGCAPNHYNAATKSLKKSDYTSAVQSLELGAESGDPRCAYLLGAMLLEGDQVEADPVAGARWMSQAAEAKLADAQTYLGTLYWTGNGVEQDATEAVKWYRAAAEQGEPVAQASFGIATFYGVGIEADRIEGYVWTKIAAKRGVDQATEALPEMRASLTVEEKRAAGKRVTEILTAVASSNQANWSGNRPRHGSNNLRRAAEARAMAGAARAAAGY
jgi:TPR repeat protein